MSRPRFSLWLRTLVESITVVLLALVLALLTNGLRRTGAIPLVADRPYQTLVPCPEFEGGRADPVAATDLSLTEPGLLLVDAREREAFARWHAPGARSVPYDYLEPTAKEMVQALLERRPRRVVVYGDGQDPDSGQQLALELSSKGLRNVGFVKGGAPALGARLKTGGRP